MVKACNSEIALRKRKCQDALKLCGLGTVVFAFWSVAKFLLQWLTQGSSVIGDISDVSQAALTIGIAATILLIVVDFLLRIYVWRKVGLEADGKHQGNLFLIITALVLIVNVAIFIPSFASEAKEGIKFTFLSESLLDLVDDIILAAILFLTVRFRALEKLTEGEN